MNILVVPTTDWIYNPNPNRLNFIFDNLVQRGHNVYVIHFRLSQFSNNTPRDTWCKLVPVDAIEFKDQSLYYIFNVFRIFKTIKHTVADKKIDVILTANIIPAFLSNFVGGPVVHDYLDHWEESASVCYPNGSFKQRVVKSVVKMITDYNLLHASIIITVTDELKNMILERLEHLGRWRHELSPPVTVIPNGVDTSLLYPMDKDCLKEFNLGSSDIRVIGYVGTLENWVDFEPIFRNLKSLNAILLVVGSALYTSYEQYLHERVRHYGIEQNVVFTGHVPYSVLREYISIMDIGLNPLLPMEKNIYSAGGKIFNYLACGVPVLSTDIVSLRGIASQYPGAITFYKDENLWMVASSIFDGPHPDVGFLRGIAEQYDWEDISIKYEHALECAITFSKCGV
jgi:glycosyltransferase involved in cell wall biosynthesis